MIDKIKIGSIRLKYIKRMFAAHYLPASVHFVIGIIPISSDAGELFEASCH